MTSSGSGALAYDDWDRIVRDGAFEETLDALRDVVAQLEAGSLRLDDAVHCYELGSGLARRCERLLDEAELRVSRIEDDPGDEDRPEAVAIANG
jgi:exodeoxyribonuclease VII small subunit